MDKAKVRQKKNEEISRKGLKEFLLKRQNKVYRTNYITLESAIYNTGLIITKLVSAQQLYQTTKEWA